MKIEAGGFTMQGRRSENQDAYAVTHTRWGVVVTVCDGLGGHEGGREAAELVTATVHLVAAGAMPSESTEQLIRRAVKAAHRRVRDGQHERLSEMMTTIVVWAWRAEDPTVCTVGHLGDSRAYLYRPSATELLQLTKDHAAGRHTVLCTVGARDQDGEPEVRTLTCLPRDTFLLCTDGLHGTLSSEGLVSGLYGWRASPPAGAAEGLCNWAFAEGSQDNITAVVIRLT